MSTVHSPLDTPPAKRASRKALAVLLSIGAAVGFILANINFISVAIRSEPACVDHLKVRSEIPGAYRAAKSNC